MFITVKHFSIISFPHPQTIQLLLRIWKRKRMLRIFVSTCSSSSFCLIHSYVEHLVNGIWQRADEISFSPRSRIQTVVGFLHCSLIKPIRTCQRKMWKLASLLGFSGDDHWKLHFIFVVIVSTCRAHVVDIVGCCWEISPFFIALSIVYRKWFHLDFFSFFHRMMIDVNASHAERF